MDDMDQMNETYVIVRSETLTDGRRGAAPSAGAVDEVEIRDATSPAEAAELRLEEDVKSIAVEMPTTLHAPVDTDGAPADDTATAWGVSAVGADVSSMDGSGIIVAVLDTGIDAAHPAFADLDVVQQDFTGEGDGDSHGHGTHCAGTIAGRAVDGVRIGIAPKIDKLLVGKVLNEDGRGTTTAISRGMRWAIDHEANVISMSLGLDFPGRVERLVEGGMPLAVATSRALVDYRANLAVFEDVVRLARSSGRLTGAAGIVVAAAGNESRREVHSAFTVSTAPPAAAEDAVSVGALARSEAGLRVADFSNTDPVVSGPGVEIRSAATGGGLCALSGTSMAAPHVAGVAALWAQRLLETTGRIRHIDLKSELVASCRTGELAAPFRPSDIGRGIVHAPS